METPIHAPPVPRWRRVVRIAWPFALGIAAIVFLVVRFTGNAGEAPLPAAPNEPAVNVDQSALTPEAREVAEGFILTAVAREHTGASWKLIDPSYGGKSDYTKSSWAKGDIPVVPAGYPFRKKDVKLTVKGVYPDSLLLDVLILPSNDARAKTFDLSLKPHRSGPKTRWLVDYWMTNYDSGVFMQPK